VGTTVCWNNVAQETWWVTELAGTMWHRRHGWFQSLPEQCGRGDMVGNSACWNIVVKLMSLAPWLSSSLQIGHFPLHRSELFICSVFKDAVRDSDRNSVEC
jgi:hypothetical protein